MKTKIIILALALIIGGVIGGYINNRFFKSVPQPGYLKLEEILSIKELHLVKHGYQDLFFLYRKNDPTKPVRAIAKVPVTITSYVNLKEIRIVRVNDSIKKVILPQARLNAPSYEIDKMTVIKTRSFQLHAGKDHYPEVSKYLSESLSQRMDSIRALAIENKILEQAEAEGKDYIEHVLIAVGRPDIIVSFGNEKKDREITQIQQAYGVNESSFYNRADTTHYIMGCLIGGPMSSSYR
jgi:hypothetical protein